MSHVTWYFDFISPYSYFSLHTFGRLPRETEVRYQPILFAGLLNHWGQKGPAEIPPKRVWTYRSCIWWAKQNKVPFRMPKSHPFNSLPYLRLSSAAGNSLAAVRSIFDALWTTGADPADPRVIADLGESLGVASERLSDGSVKTSLRDATAEAANRGVFGVPTFYVDGEVFWGSDAVDFVAAYLQDPGVLDTEEMKRAAQLPVSASR